MPFWQNHIYKQLYHNSYNVNIISADFVQAQPIL
nr:MAG TPA: hypothetical protein [Caudoviricetes sp.]